MRHKGSLDPKVLADNPRARYQDWKRYEQVVLAAMRSHPRPYIYAPGNFAPSTVCSRIRDAVRGKIAFDYDADTISSEEVRRWFDEVVFKYDKHQIYIGSPQQVHDLLHGEEKTDNKTELVFNTLTFEEIAAFVLLLAGLRLQGPIRVLQPPDVVLLHVPMNVELLNQPDGSLLIF